MRKNMVMLDTGYLFLCLLFASMSFWMIDKSVPMLFTLGMVGVFVLYVGVNMKDHQEDK